MTLKKKDADERFYRLVVPKHHPHTSTSRFTHASQTKIERHLYAHEPHICPEFTFIVKKSAFTGSPALFFPPRLVLRLCKFFNMNIPKREAFHAQWGGKVQWVENESEKSEMMKFISPGVDRIKSNPHFKVYLYFLCSKKTHKLEGYCLGHMHTWSSWLFDGSCI